MENQDILSRFKSDSVRIPISSTVDIDYKNENVHHRLQVLVVSSEFTEQPEGN
jgi:hypothetical protein|tara:strand:+ start:315 stop:473 length:159 start_codon:yes stop_codon:yes gene_type:complete